MKLISIKTGVEYEKLPNELGYGCHLSPTGKTYEVREMYGAMVYALGTLPGDDDTHKFLCFGELIEKPNLMPSIEAGDFLVGKYADVYVFDNDDIGSLKEGVVTIYRHGKQIWSEENK